MEDVQRLGKSPQFGKQFCQWPVYASCRKSSGACRKKVMRWSGNSEWFLLFGQQIEY